MQFLHITSSRHRHDEVKCQLMYFLWVLISALRPEVHYCLHICVQGLVLLSNLIMGHTFACSFQQRAQAPIIREGYGTKTHTVTSIERTQDADICPEPVGTSGH
jgi:hypothetical protein